MGANRENPFGIPRSPLALRAEASFTPQDSLSHHTLGRIIGRLHPRIVHKRPQIVPLIENAPAPARQRLAAVGAKHQQRFHLHCMSLTGINLVTSDFLSAGIKLYAAFTTEWTKAGFFWQNWFEQ
jgi:hypothetical protein